MGLNFDNLMVSARDRLLTDTEIKNFSPGSIARSLLEIGSSELVSLSEYLDSRFVQSMITTATGEFLDQIGKLFLLDRSSSNYPLGEVKFTIDPASGKTVSDLKTMIYDDTGVVLEDIVIPALTKIEDTDGTYEYKTTDDIVLTDDGVTVSALSVYLGAAANAPSGVLTVWNNSDLNYVVIRDLILVSNPTPITTGADTESDNNFRYRIINAMKGAEKANLTAIRLACLSVPGVSDVLIRNYEYGIGTFGVFVISESPVISNGVLSAVQTAINETQAAGERGVASAPTYKACSMSINLEFKAATPTGTKDDVTRTVVTNVVNYINNLSMGTELVFNEIIQRIMETSEDIHDVDIQKFGTGEYNLDTGLIDYFEYSLNTNQDVGAITKWISNTKLVSACYD